MIEHPDRSMTLGRSPPALDVDVTGARFPRRRDTREVPRRLAWRAVEYQGVGVPVVRPAWGSDSPSGAAPGHALHAVGDNLRLPYAAFGIRVDLNHGKWHGSNNGNFP